MDFDYESHTYRKNGVVYESVSSLIGKYKKPFNSEFVATRVAQASGREVEDILHEWDLKRTISTNFGNAVHESIELFIKYGQKPKQDFLLKVINEFEELTAGKKLHSEVILEDDEHRVAGTVDILDSLGNKRVNIDDIKTNGDLYKKARGKFLPPFDDLPDSTLNEYRLKASVYKHLAQVKGLTVEELHLYHYTDHWEVITLEPINIDALWKTKQSL